MLSGLTTALPLCFKRDNAPLRSLVFSFSSLLTLRPVLSTDERQQIIDLHHFCDKYFIKLEVNRIIEIFFDSLLFLSIKRVYMCILVPFFFTGGVCYEMG